MIRGTQTEYSINRLQSSERFEWPLIFPGLDKGTMDLPGLPSAAGPSLRHFRFVWLWVGQLLFWLLCFHTGCELCAAREATMKTSAWCVRGRNLGFGISHPLLPANPLPMDKIREATEFFSSRDVNKVWGGSCHKGNTDLHLCPSHVWQIA